MGKPRYGDVIYVERRIPTYYRHFGVYSGDDHVIHYASGGFLSKGIIKETSLMEFLSYEKGGKKCYPKKYFICTFDKNGIRGKKTADVPRYIGGKGSSAIVSSSVMSTFGVALKADPITNAATKVLENLWERLNARIYSPEETVARARSRIGKGDYSLFGNNCEHFAIWCKTGIHESEQVKEVIRDMYADFCKDPKDFLTTVLMLPFIMFNEEEVE